MSAPTAVETKLRQLCRRRNRQIADLVLHQSETGVPLPYKITTIVDLETHGYLINLTTGEIIPDPDANT